MRIPKIQTKVVESKKKLCWNVVSINVGDKRKIASVPYTDISEESGLTVNKSKQQAYEHAVFISSCFNYSYTTGKRMSKKIIVPSIEDVDIDINSEINEKPDYVDADYMLD